MKNIKDILNNDISDELLAAYIDGNTTESENALIEHTLNGDSMLAEANEIAKDCVSFGSNFDWELHKGDFGFWELGLPPAVTEDVLYEKINNPELSQTKRTYGNESNNEIDTFDPHIWQGDQPTCAIRSQEIILRDYGIFHTQEELIEFATKKGWFNPDPQKGGSDKYAIGNLLDACGIPTTRTDNATIYDIISELKVGHRVIVSVDANELWVKKEPNLLKRLLAQVNNKTNDKTQEFLGVEGANHALVVAGVTVNPSDPADIIVTLVDSGTGDLCLEYRFKDFLDAWSDGHCHMISTNIPAPFQYNYHTHQIEPSNIATTYSPSMAQMPEGLTNRFHLAESYYDNYRGFSPSYDNLSEQIAAEGIDLSKTPSNHNSDIDAIKTQDDAQTGLTVETEDKRQPEENIGNGIMEEECQTSLTQNDNNEVTEEEHSESASMNEEDESEEM